MSNSRSSAPREERTKLRQAAEYAFGFVQPGMVIGLGTGSTAIFATRRIAQLFGEGKLKEIVGFATSKTVSEESQQLGIPMGTEDIPRSIDLTIDGADEVDQGLNLLKGVVARCFVKKSSLKPVTGFYRGG